MVSVIAAGGMVIGGADRFRASAQEAPAAQEAPVARAAPAADQAPTQDAAPVLPSAAEENAAPPEDPGVQRVGTAGSEAPAGEAPITPPNIGGPIATAGGLVFIAATTDKLIRALDIETGELLWRDTLPADGQATPMTFESSGRQFVALAPGGHHFMETPVGDHVIAWALPE
ncbi:MAG: PQQ-binding-like beta-propeller repeat protein [Defluviimonas sp.]|nr:PQQ-binding-like beta-propeller repeat protein [Defluviimonas sp.]